MQSAPESHRSPVIVIAFLFLNIQVFKHWWSLPLSSFDEISNGRAKEMIGGHNTIDVGVPLK